MSFDAFIKFDGGGIKGESTDSKHKDWIEIYSYSFGMSQAVSGSMSTAGAKASGRADFSDFSVMKALDSASPKLMVACANGTDIPTVELELCRATGDKQKFYKITFENVIITSVSPSGSSGGDVPMESVSFAYSKIKWEYTGTDPRTGKAGGATEGHWDLASNSGG